LILSFLQQNCRQASRQVLEQRADIKKDSDDIDDDEDFDDDDDDDNNNNKRNEK
jgi:hypothetical protein